MGKLFNLLFYFVLAVNLICVSNSQTTNPRFCGDQDCQKIISTGKTLVAYNPNTKGKVSFRAGDSVEIYSKPTVQKGDALWDIKIGSRRGFVPGRFLKEQKILVKQNELIIVPYPAAKPSDNEDKAALKSSILTKTEETSPTPPLPNEPAMVTSQQNNEGGINASEISSDPAKSIVVDGTTINVDSMPGEGEQDGEEYEEEYEEDEDEDDDVAVGDEEDDLDSENSITFEGTKNDKSSKALDYKKIATEQSPQPVETGNSNLKKEEAAKESSNKNPELPPLLASKEQGFPVNKADLANQETVDDLNNITSNALHQINITAPSLEQNESIEKENITVNGENLPTKNNEKSSEVPTSDSGLQNVEQPTSIPVSDLEKDQLGLSENITDGKIATDNLQEQSVVQQNSEEAQKVQEQVKPSEPSPLNSDSTELLNKSEEKKEAGSQNNSGDVTSDINRSDSSNKENIEQKPELLEQKPIYENLPEEQTTEKKTELNKNENSDETLKLGEQIRFSGESGIQEPTQKKVELSEQAHLLEAKPPSEVSISPEPTLSPEANIVNKNTGGYQPKPPLFFNTKAGLQTQDPSQQTPKSESLPITEEKVSTEQQLQIPTTETPKSQQQEEHFLKTETLKNVEEIKPTDDPPNEEKLIQSVPEATQIPEEVIPSTTESTVETPLVEDPFKKYPASEVVTETVQQTFTESPIETVAQTFTGDPTETIVETFTESPLEAQQHFDEVTTETVSQTFTESPLEAHQHHEEVTTESASPIADEATTQQSTSHVKNYPEQVNTDWFFSNVLDTVYNFWSTQSKEEEPMSEDEFSAELHKTLFPEKAEQTKEVSSLPDGSEGFCEKLTPDACPSDLKKPIPSTHLQARDSLQTCSSEKDFFSSLSDKVLEMVDLLACLLIAAFTTLLFTFGYYCICHSRKESVLISKLNIVERSLLASTKESAILKHDLIETRNKLISIEDNSFGSNDMVIALKRDLQDSEEARIRLQEQVASLEKELENAAEAGLELNKIVSELLNNQSGDESIISSVEELQKQLNEQQNTIIQINTTLAEKSRENSELQLIIANQGARFDEEVKELKQEKEDLQKDKGQIETELEELRQKMEEQLAKAEEDKRAAVVAIGKEMSALKERYNEMQRRLQTSEARVQVLEECLNGMKNSTKFNIKELLDAVNLKTDLLATRRERDSLKERLEGEIDARKLLEDHVSIISEEVSRLKQEYNQSEKDKVEAKTRLEVLSSYFKEKETQLQKELSLKEALWLKQQGETSSTVERVQHMQDEIQFLKSQNDSLRAEIEAQTATHKAQIANLENRAHETWLAARQSERKMEEARTEATALRRKLTSLAGNSAANDVNSQNRVPNSTDGMQNDVNNVPSPVHMDSPGSPLIGGLPPPLPFLPPPPFMGPPHPFMPMPPPFMPPGEMRPPPLGRLMSPPPPPPPDRYSPSLVDERNRYTPENGRYSPDSRYNYTTDIMSNYDTETDFSPPPSPGGRPGGVNTGGGYSGRDRDRDRERDRERSRVYKPYSPPPPNSTDRNKKSKGILSSGSADSYDSRKSKGKRKV